MAQPAKRPARAPCSTPPVHTEDAVTSVHPVDERLRPTRLVPAARPALFAFGTPEFQPAAILSLCIVMLVPMTECSAGMPGPRTDGLPTSSFARNTGVVSLPRVRSRHAVAGGAGTVLFGAIAVGGIRTPSEALAAVALGAGVVPPAAPTFHCGFPARAQTVLGSGICALALAAVLLDLLFHHLGTRSGQPAPALKSSWGPAVPSSVDKYPSTDRH